MGDKKLVVVKLCGCCDGGGTWCFLRGGGGAALVGLSGWRRFQGALRLFVCLFVSDNEKERIKTILVWETHREGNSRDTQRARRDVMIQILCFTRGSQSSSCCLCVHTLLTSISSSPGASWCFFVLLNAPTLRVHKIFTCRILLKSHLLCTPTDTLGSTCSCRLVAWESIAARNIASLHAMPW